MKRLDRAAMLEIRRHVKTLLEQSGKGMLSAEIVAFSEGLKTDHGLTIDLQAAHELGEALVIVHPAAPARTLPGFELLSAREAEVALLVCRGLRNRDIAELLHISLATVKDHVHEVLEKTRMPSRNALTACYLGTNGNTAQA